MNTGALYIKIIISAFVTLLSTRIALKVLGAESFGLYYLIVGIVIMLSFFKGALMISVQRFLSIAIGENNNIKLSNIFNVSILIHFLLAIVLALLFIIVQPFLFNGFLNIDSSMINEAKSVYVIMVISTVITLMAVPYNAVINAHEEMWFFAISEIIAALLKLVAAFSLLYIKSNILITYSLLMFFAVFIGALTQVIWGNYRYNECKLLPKKMVTKHLFFEMFSFAGWNTLGSAGILIRNQGIAVIINIYFGTLLNAAYGVANNLNSMVLLFATTLTTVFTPMIVQARGEGNNEKMLFYSVLSSKMSFFLSGIIALPLLMYTDFILNIWLDKVPEYSIIFSRLTILLFLISQTHAGISRAIYAVGNIKWFQIVVFLLLICVIPIGRFLFESGATPYAILIVMIILQIFIMITTAIFASIQTGLKLNRFLINSIFLPAVIFVIIWILGYIISKQLTINIWINFIIVTISAISLYSIGYYKIVLTKKEASVFINILERLKDKLIN